jgi:hypothetical protein
VQPRIKVARARHLFLTLFRDVRKTGGECNTYENPLAVAQGILDHADERHSVAPAVVTKLLHVASMAANVTAQSNALSKEVVLVCCCSQLAERREAVRALSNR